MTNPPDPRMNQTGGLMFGVSKIIDLLKQKGVVTELEIDAVLEAAENPALVTFVETPAGDEWRNQMLFPLRMLRVLNRTWAPGTMPEAPAIKDFLQGRTHEL